MKYLILGLLCLFTLGEAAKLFSAESIKNNILFDSPPKNQEKVQNSEKELLQEMGELSLDSYDGRMLTQHRVENPKVLLEEKILTEKTGCKKSCTQKEAYWDGSQYWNWAYYKSAPYGKDSNTNYVATKYKNFFTDAW